MRLRALSVSLVLAGFAAMAVMGVLFAPQARAAATSAVAQGFSADTGRGTLAPGALVSFKDGSRSVELAATDTADRLAGVVGQSPLVVISGGGSEAQVIVSGTATALVSDINGPIHAGDKISASPIAGIGMTATSSSKIVGIAQGAFNTSTSQLQTITDSHGKQHSVHLGYVAIQVGLAYYQPAASNFLPPFVQNFANTVAGRQVSLIRIFFCTVLLLLSFVSLSVLIYSSARSAMVSIGRNPLASGEIRRGLYQIGLVTVVVWGCALVACFLILRT